MMMTILFYSLFTGLSVLSTSVWDFSVYRFLTGLGVGGQFAVGVALVAEVMPDRARPFALGWLQALSAIGNMMAALIGIGLGQLEQSGAIGSAWRMMFVVGALPAFLCIFVFKKLKEPEQWQKARRESKHLGSMADLFTDPRWRRNAIVGMLLAFSGVVGLWGIGFFSFDLLSSVLDKTFRAQGLAPSVDCRQEDALDGNHFPVAKRSGRSSESMPSLMSLPKWVAEKRLPSLSPPQCSPLPSPSGTSKTSAISSG